MKDKPWIAVDLFTNEVLGNYETEYAAWSNNADKAVDILYRPHARKVI